MASDADCQAMQSGKAHLWPARDLPPLTSHSGLTDYPPEARRLAERGLVDLTFSIDSAGRPVHMRQVCYAEPRLTASAVRGLASARFLVPPNWQQAGGPSREFGFEFQYRLVDLKYSDVRYRKVSVSTVCHKSTVASPRMANAQLMPICGIRILN
ncbi:MAG TPA: hypothetical protein VFA39_05400 [Steroidobacteraceae bacterium]|nr:hypothetical protein [Steroidobacteraceae bacterium]